MAISPVSWNNMIDTLGITNTIVDLTSTIGTGTPKLANPIYYNLDLVHPNDAGDVLIANKYRSDYPDLF